MSLQNHDFITFITQIWMNVRVIHAEIVGPALMESIHFLVNVQEAGKEHFVMKVDLMIN